MKKRIAALLVLALGVGMVGCAQQLRRGHEVVVETSGDKPRWFGRDSEFRDDRHYFKGVGEGRTQNLAKEAARLEGLSQLATRISEKVVNTSVASYRELGNSDEEAGNYKEKTTAAYTGVLKFDSVALEESFWERLEVTEDEDSVASKFRYAVWLSISDEALKRAIKRAMEPAIKHAATAGDRKAEQAAKAALERLLKSDFELEAAP